MATSTSSTRKTTPAKKTTGKAPAKRPASPARKTTAKKALPKTTPVNTVVDLRHPLPVRRKVSLGPKLTIHEQATARAILASAKAQLPISAWTWTGPVARLDDGTVLTHTPPHAYTAAQPTFHAAIRCPHGAVHAYTIHTALDLHRARQITALCDQRTDTAPAEPAPNPVVRALGDALTRARSAAADTQPLSAQDIAEGLAARADHETPKEHPES
jgi:hypothetical protein